MNSHLKINKFDEEIITEDNRYNNEDAEWVECMDCIQRKMICIISILIIGTILLVLIYTINT